MTARPPGPKAPRSSLAAVTEEVVECRACPRLVEWREQVAREKRAAYVNETYWSRPLPSFGDPDARLLIVGLAPAAHGGNRTGRIFTGDRSADWLFGSLFRCGFANQPLSVDRNDGLELKEAFIAAAVRCAPPANKPTPAERDRCLPYLVREMDLLANLEVVVALGAFAWDASLRAHASIEGSAVSPKPRFGHGARAELERFTLMGSYHPSQQNTFTGRLTEAMLDDIFMAARRLF